MCIRHAVWSLDCSVSQIQAGQSIFLKLAVQPLFLYTIFWTLMLTTTVTVLALSASISPSMEIIEACSLQWNKASLACRQCFLLLLDGTHDGLCVFPQSSSRSQELISQCTQFLLLLLLLWQPYLGPSFGIVELLATDLFGGGGGGLANHHKH